MVYVMAPLEPSILLTQSFSKESKKLLDIICVYALVRPSRVPFPVCMCKNDHAIKLNKCNRVINRKHQHK